MTSHTYAHAAPHPGRGLGRSGFRLGAVAGVRITADWSLLLIFALVLFNLGAGVLPGWHPEWGPALTWGVALAAALLFFASIVAHELSHALVARRNGIPISRITLFLFGGLAHMEGEPPTPRSELLMAAVGPITSLVIGLAAITVGSWLAGPDFAAHLREDPRAALASLGPTASLLMWLGPVNLVLGLFNLVPGFPLDGGRVLRAVLWWAMGDLKRATLWASRAGRAVAFALMAVGAANFLIGAPVQGLWLVVIGWFLANAASSSYQQIVVREVLRGVPISRIMRTRFSTVDAATDIETLVREEVMASDQLAFPVVGPQEELLGLVGVEELREVPRAEWSSTPVSRVMTPLEQVVTLPPDASAEQALGTLARRGVDQIAVMDARRIIGLVRSQDLLKWLSLRGDDEGAALAAAAR